MEDWVETAKKLPCGKSVRVKCCQSDLSRIISHTPDGYSTVCFRCGLDKRGFVPHGQRTVSEMIRHRKEYSNMVQQRGKIVLPPDFTDDIPPIGMQWLLKGGVNSTMIEHYGIGWSDSLGRVVIPVWSTDDDDEPVLVASQARAVYPKQAPKYLNMKAAGYTSVMFWADPETLFSDPVAEDWVVLTEDVLSTIRVGRVQDAGATMGTYLSHHNAAAIMEFYNNVIIWYDGDKAGKKGAAKARDTLLLQGANVRVLTTEHDPKKYSNEDIRQYLTDVIHQR